MKRLMKSRQSYPAAVKSVFIIAVIALIGFMTTQALFVDRETSQENQFVVGTLDMTVEGENSTQAETISVTGIGSQNITSGGKEWQIQNVGSLPGELLFEVAQIENNDNGCNEPEALVDTSCDSPGVNQGELGQHIVTTVSARNGSETPSFSGTLSTGSEANYKTTWKNTMGKIIVPPGQSRTIKLQWSTQQSTFENEVQSDSVTFETIFQLRQVLPDSNETVSPNP